MKAIHLEDFGSADNFKVIDAEVPGIQPNEVLVEVKAFAINPVETVIRAGYAFTEAFENLEPRVLGWDIAGKVVNVGDQVTDFQDGDPVFGMLKFPEPAMGYAAYTAAPTEHLAKIPNNATWEEAAGASLAALTAWQGLLEYGNLQQGEKVLILAAGGGVGHFAIQMAKYQGAYVIGTASAEKRSFIQYLGADEHIDYRSQSFETLVSDADLVLDAAGGDDTYRALDAVKAGGRIVSLIPTANDLADKAKDQNKSAQVMMVQPSGGHMEAIARLMEDGHVKTYIDQLYTMEAIDKAHEHVESGRTKGKVVVKAQE